MMITLTLDQALDLLCTPPTLRGLQSLAQFYHATQPPEHFHEHMLASFAANPAIQQALAILWEHPAIAAQSPPLAVLFPRE